MIVPHFWRAIVQLGWLDGIVFALKRLLDIIAGGRADLHKYYLVAQPIAEKCWLPPKRGASLEIRQITESGPVIRDFPRPDRVISDRFRQGAVCLAAFKMDRFVGFIWFTPGPYQEDEVRCRYVPAPDGKAAWDFDVYLDMEHRNGIAFLKLWDAANSFLASRGFRWSLSRISAFNRGSLSAHVRIGAKRIGTVTFLTVGPFQISAATVPPFFHVSTHQDSFPVFVLNAEQGR